ncbi:topoisomerase DNA-binding C4 zinc finger domain-containing protein [Photobacterium leiognathi]|uniref:topoisomerase DNA-binding C4 zinc finger domain-containing protein n=1 Tax=Photobacterium leiognathi TaxID=553611 RepID=UPI0029821989|nr:topoisomerase DNA-binding C4 zinc finger domain-containing protein [Photobacterium leiognathi]
MSTNLINQAIEGLNDKARKVVFTVSAVTRSRHEIIVQKAKQKHGQNFSIDSIVENSLNKLYSQLERELKIQPAEAIKICPKCGDWLAIKARSGSTRKFLGCMTYPKCKHSENISSQSTSNKGN